MKKFASAVLSAAMIISLVACSGGSAPETTAAPETAAATETTTEAAAPAATEAASEAVSETAAPESGGKKSVVIGYQTANMTWDPIKSADNLAHEVNGNIYATLYSCDNNLQYVPEMAEKVDVSEDGCTYTFTIRDAHWSNGDPVTAYDFDFAWKRAADPTTGSQFVHLFRLMNIKNGAAVANGEMDPSELGCYAVDEKTFVVELTVATPFFTSLAAFDPLSCVNQKFYEEEGDKYCTTIDDMIFCGPYKVSEWDPDGNTVVITKNEEYWDAANVDIDEITFKLVPDAQSGVMAFESGDLDYFQLSGDLVSLYESNEYFGSIPGNFNWYIYFNGEKITNQKLRQAIAYAMDREAICNNVLQDGSVPQYNIFMNGLMTNPDGRDFNDATTKQYQYDPDKAKEIWAEAQAEGAPTSFTLTYESDDATVALVAQYVAATIESTLEGFTVNLECIPKSNRIENMQNGKYEVALTRWGPNFTDATSTLSLYMTGNVYNYHNCSIPEYDQLLTDAMTTLGADYDARWDTLVKAEDLLMQNASCLPLYQIGISYLQRDTIEDMVMHMCGTLRFWKYIHMK